MNMSYSELSREQYAENAARGNPLGTHMLRSNATSTLPNAKGQTMGTKKIKYNKQDIGRLPNDKPVLYRIETDSGNLNYAGVAKRGRVQERISEHLNDIPA